MNLTTPEILELVKQYERDSKALKEEVLKLCWYMRGGITYDEGMCLSVDERKIISKLITENMEVTKKTGLPFF